MTKISLDPSAFIVEQAMTYADAVAKRVRD
jgi:hypothetical protein